MLDVRCGILRAVRVAGGDRDVRALPSRIVLCGRRCGDAVLPRDGVHRGGVVRAAAVLLECEHARGEWNGRVGGRREFAGCFQ